MKWVLLFFKVIPVYQDLVGTICCTSNVPQNITTCQEKSFSLIHFATWEQINSI